MSGQSNHRRYRRKEKRRLFKLFLLMLCIALTYAAAGVTALTRVGAPPVLTVIVAAAAGLSIIPSFIYWRESTKWK